MDEDEARTRLDEIIDISHEVTHDVATKFEYDE